MRRYRTLVSPALLLSAALLAACTTGSKREAPRTAATPSKLAASRAECSPDTPEAVARKPIAAKKRPGTQRDATYVTAYAHNSRLLVKEGDTVKAGQVIARMGDSGTDRVMLHFELRRNGNAVDPVPYFSDRD